MVRWPDAVHTTDHHFVFLEMTQSSSHTMTVHVACGMFCVGEHFVLCYTVRIYCIFVMVLFMYIRTYVYIYFMFIRTSVGDNSCEKPSWRTAAGVCESTGQRRVHPAQDGRTAEG